jgi:hypothetical protein
MSQAVNEGFVRLLATLADGSARDRTELARAAGEPLSVVRALLDAETGWCVTAGDRVTMTDSGLAMLGRVLGPRLILRSSSDGALPDAWRGLAARRGAR